MLIALVLTVGMLVCAVGMLAFTSWMEQRLDGGGDEALPPRPDEE